MRYICSLPNSDADGKPKELFSDDPVLIARFIEAEDRPGRGVYECLNPLEPGAKKRSLETVAELRRIYFDLDLQHIEESRDEVIHRLRQLPFEFTEVRDSGSGNLHLVTETKDPPPRGTPEYVRIAALWKRLAERLAADPAPTHPAALIRCVGTHNTKSGNRGLCRQLDGGDEPLRGSGKPIDVTELEALDDLLGQPLLTYKEQAASASNGYHTDSAAASEHKDPIDVDARLAAMRWHGAGDSAINVTQRDVMASLIAHSVSLNEATATVLDATRKCVAGDPEATKWDWGQEELDIAWSGARLINKNPKYADRLPDDLRVKFEELEIAGQRPSIGKNNYRLFVRAARGATEAAKAGPAKPDVTRARGTNQAPTADTKGPRFRLLRYCDLRPGMGDQDYLVDELLPTEGLIVVWGKFKCLKTFWVYDLMLHVAKGWEYRDRAVRQGMVIYCAFEGAHGFGKRTEAQRRHYNLADDDDVPLHVMPCQMNLVTDHKKFVADIGGQLEAGEKPAAVVLDTLNRSLVGSESKDADMSAYIAAASAIREAFKCLVIIVHHCGWDETRPRGHSSLSAAIEGQLAVTRQESHITVLIEFLRDGPEGAEIHSVTKIVNVGEDANSKPLTSLVVVPSNEGSRRASDWPKALVVFQRAMKNALAAHGEDFHENVLEPPVRAVAVENVRQEFYAIYPADGDTPEQRQETKRQQFKRYLKRAQTEGLIQSREPDGKPALVWFMRHNTTWEDEHG